MDKEMDDFQFIERNDANTKTKEMIGEIIVKPKDNTISLGYTFSYKYHRQGCAFEALTVLHEHLHKMAPEWEFISFTECENIAGIELLKKLGYKDLGYVSCFRYYRKSGL